MRRHAAFLTTVLLASLTVVPVANGATELVFYAAPTATGSGTCESPANACTIATAVLNAGDGDFVVLAGGTYESGRAIGIGHSITVEPAPGATPIINIFDATTAGVAIEAPNVSISGVEVEVAGAVAIKTDVGATNAVLSHVKIIDSSEGVEFLDTGSLTDSEIDNTGLGIENVTSGITVDISDTTFDADGYGLYSDGGLTNAVRDLISNSTTQGVYGQVVMVDSTVTGSTGDGIFTNGKGAAVIGSTIVKNGGLGIDTGNASGAQLGADIVAGNSNGSCSHTEDDKGYNIDGDGTCGLTGTGSVSSSPTIQSSLGILADNHGPTKSIGLVSTSPAIGLVTGTIDDSSAGGLPICGTPDQRGFTRPATTCDAGAFQTGAPAPVATVKVSSSTKRATLGKPVTFTVHLTGNWSAPTGVVSFAVRGTSIPGCASRPITNGKATCTTSALSIGKPAIAARYSGDDVYATKTSTLTGFSVAAPTTTRASSSKKNTSRGNRIAISARTKGPRSAPAAQGTVVFIDNGHQFAKKTYSAASRGRVKATLKLAKTGKHHITVKYLGNATNLPSTGHVTVTVTR